jgi:protein SCO1
MRLLLLALLLFLVPACKKNDPALPEYGSVGEFSLRDHEGAAFTQQQALGKIWVAAFIFTRCPTVCPMITDRMKGLQAKAKSRDIPLHFVSFSVDPEYDTPEVLKAYAKERGADLSSWSFVTGDYESIKKTSVEGFKQALEGRADPSQDHFGILHGSHLVLVDAKLEMRGFYRSRDDAEMDKLLEDAARLAGR